MRPKMDTHRQEKKWGNMGRDEKDRRKEKGKEITVSIKTSHPQKCTSKSPMLQLPWKELRPQLPGQKRQGERCGILASLSKREKGNEKL